jgi:hypothetical protein
MAMTLIDALRYRFFFLLRIPTCGVGNLGDSLSFVAANLASHLEIAWLDLDPTLSASVPWFQASRCIWVCDLE